jgi:hypothetical protein
MACRESVGWAKARPRIEDLPRGRRSAVPTNIDDAVGTALHRLNGDTESWVRAFAHPTKDNNWEKT